MQPALALCSKWTKLKLCLHSHVHIIIFLATESCPETTTQTTTQTTYQTDFGSSVGGETKSITESIISSYGVGPTDENGRPLFGLKALRTSGEVKFVDDGGR